MRNTVTLAQRLPRLALLLALLCLSGGALTSSQHARPAGVRGSGMRTVSPGEQHDAASYWTPDRMARSLPPRPPSPSGAVGPVPLPDAALQAAPATPPPAPALPPSADPPEGQAFSGIAAVGALFSADDDGSNVHYCTASVVHSAGGDLVLTAAHCIHDGEGGDYRTKIAFVPGYHDGQQPYGTWVATKLVVNPRWADSSDPDVDVGFMVVHQADNPRRIEDTTGANEFHANSSPSGTVRVTGYPNDLDQPITCENSTRWATSSQLRFDCDGFSSGTSGSPWVVNPDPVTQLGLVIGVVGGYQRGGRTADVSYSPYFGDEVQALYDTAAQYG